MVKVFVTDLPYLVDDNRSDLELSFKVEGRTVIVIIGKEDCQDPNCLIKVIAVQQEERQ